jgi:hypothetical protein
MAGSRGYLRIVNWRKVQNYAAARPPWIRLYCSLYTDDGPSAQWQAAERWRSLGLAGQGLLVNLWLYAAVHGLEGILWGDPLYLRQELKLQADLDLTPLLEKCFAARFLEWVERAGPNEPWVSAGGEEGGGEREGKEVGGRGERETESREQRAENREQRTDRERPGEPTESGTSCARTSGLAETERESAERERPEGQTAEGQTAEHQTEASRQSTVVPGSVRIITNPLPPQGPSAAPPFPLVSDSRAGLGPGGPGPGRSPPGRSTGPETLGSILRPTLAAWMDPLRADWVAAVYRALGFVWPLDSRLAREQMGSFESVYDRLMLLRDLSDEAKHLVLEHDLRWAEKHGRAKRHKKRGAVFVAIHKRRVAEYLARAGGPRRR